ncbi:response regulator [Ferrovibrio sp.]|uniref:response regulator n=1 Tax=Ferrovibrio sp. TaxID=1917215 RepID=UPI0025C15CEF|nr:response regulator [Ferrovibrio sp.]MBX3455904.1 response regulator [Ferrovibrio sp.]
MPRILLVEDHAPTAAMLMAMLKGLGYARAALAPNTDQAIVQLRAGGVDLLLCDYELGMINGLTLVKMVRRPEGLGNPMLPIVMMTAHAEGPLVAEAMAAGVDDFLVKPIMPEALLRCLQQVLQRSRPYVKSRDYAGPDRRRRKTTDHPGRRDGDGKTRPLRLGKHKVWDTD